MNVVHRASYRRRRLQEYPSLGDQLDQIWRAIDELKTHSAAILPTETQEMLDRINQIKARYPKPL